MQRFHAGIFAALLLPAVTGCSSRTTPPSFGRGPEPVHGPPPSPAPTTRASGAALFDQNCVRCHGPHGRQVPGWLQGVQSSSQAQVEQIVSSGLGPMPSFKDVLSPQEIATVAAYAKAVAAAAPAAPPSAPPAAPSPPTAPPAAAPPAGRMVFSSNCVGCHGPQGKQVPGWLSAVRGMSLAQVEQVIRNGKDGMPAFGSTLSPQQVTSLAQYVKQQAGGG